MVGYQCCFWWKFESANRYLEPLRPVVSSLWAMGTSVLMKHALFMTVSEFMGSENIVPD